MFVAQIVFSLMLNLRKKAGDEKSKIILSL